MLPEPEEEPVVRALNRLSLRLRKAAGWGPPKPKPKSWTCSYCGKEAEEFHEPYAKDPSIAGTCHYWKQERWEKRQQRIADLAALVAGGLSRDPYRGTPLIPQVVVDQAWAIAEEILRREKA